MFSSLRSYPRLRLKRNEVSGQRFGWLIGWIVSHHGERASGPHLIIRPSLLVKMYALRIESSSQRGYGV
jgi:hypothetical protein